MIYYRGIKILIFSIITFFAFLSFHSSSTAQVNLPVQCEGSSCEVNDPCSQYDKGSILYLDCQKARVPKPPKSDPCANGRCGIEHPSRVFPEVQPGDACSWYWNDDVSCQQFWCSGEFNGNCEGRPREAIEACNKLRIQGCAVCEYQGNTATCRPVEQEVPTPTGCYIPLVGNACVVSADPKECPSGCPNGQTCYRGHEGAACFPTIRQGTTAVPGVVNCGGGYCNIAGGGSCVTDHQERQFCQYSDVDANRSAAGVELPEPATKTVYRNCGGSALGAIDCQPDERCWINRETGVPSCHSKDEETSLVTSLTCPSFDPKTHYCDRDGKLKKYPTSSKGVQPASNYTIPGVYDPTTKEISPEADTSQICTYSQQDTPGGPVACGIGLLKNGSCQYDSRVFKPIDCQNTEICYAKEGNNCKVGLKKGSDCDTTDVGQPIDCGLADTIGSSASGGACTYKDGKFSCDIKASPPPNTVTCVYSQEAAKGHENSTDPNDPLRKGCFVGKCAPGSPCTQGSFNVEGCAYAEGLGQPVTCPVVGGTGGGTGGGGGGTGPGGISSDIEKIIIYGKRNGPAGTRPLEYAGTRKELTASEYQKLQQQGFVDTPFQLAGVDGLQNEDEILFCAEFHPKNGIPFTKCTDAFTYFD